MRLYKNDWLQNLSKRNIIFDNFSVLNLVIRSTSHVKGHRRGGVCVLWMLLVLFCVWVSMSEKKKRKRDRQTEQEKETYFLPKSGQNKGQCFE